jgi:chromate transporter
MKRHLELFWLFAKISLFTLGGGLAMLALVERQITEKKKWMDKQEFLDVLGISQSLPGVMILNVATCAGYKIAGKSGALSACLGTAIPPFAAIVGVGWFFLKVKDSPAVERVFFGIRPAVIALIAIPVVSLFRSAGINRINFIIPLAVILAVAGFKFHPAYVILLGLAINIFYVYSQNKSRCRI